METTAQPGQTDGQEASGGTAGAGFADVQAHTAGLLYLPPPHMARVPLPALRGAEPESGWRQQSPTVSVPNQTSAGHRAAGSVSLLG